MNIFCRYTHCTLLRNKSRTLVTIIGIILSMALMTAVVEGACSGLSYIFRAEVADVGSFHGQFLEVPEEEVSALSRADDIRSTTVLQQVGWADIGSQNDFKPYLLIQSMAQDFEKMISIHLTEGRLPRNANEILLPDHLYYNGSVSYEIGDLLTLQVGQREQLGKKLTEQDAFSDSEALADTKERRYTVVGKYSRFDYSIEGFSCPGYTALTCGGAAGNCRVFFQVRQPYNYYQVIRQLKLPYPHRAHSRLLMYSGSIAYGNVAATIYGMVAVLLLLISFGAISLIYNAFSISVSKRTCQFGVLKSIGATKKQIRFIVLYEAFVLCLIAIPIGAVLGCLGIGITLYCLQDAFSVFVPNSAGVKMYLSFNLPGMAAATLICLITTLISAYLPAKKAVRIAPIDAIRQSADVRVSKRGMHVGCFIQKLFGFEGVLAKKNFKRNRRQCRSTVLSLFLSVTLFISAASFCRYLSDVVYGISAGSSSNNADIFYYGAYSSPEESDEIFQKIRSAEGVDEGAYFQNYFLQDLLAKKEDITPAVRSLWTSQDDEKYSILTNLIFLNDDEFVQLCRQNNIKPESFLDKTAPQAVCLNKISLNFVDDAKNRKWYLEEIFSDKSLPIETETVQPRVLEGYSLIKTLSKGEESKHIYYPRDSAEEVLDEDGEINDLFDESLAKILTAKEAEHVVRLTVGALISDAPYYLTPSAQLQLIYPMSMQQAVLQQLHIRSTQDYQYFFNAKNHTRAYQKIAETLSANGLQNSMLVNNAENIEQNRTVLTIIRVFTYGFIILISLIAITNVFNTISTNIMLRRREFAMLKSVGMTRQGFSKMMNYECLLYGLKALLYGLPVSFCITFLIWKMVKKTVEQAFYIPLTSVWIAVVSVFTVVFATMIYATHSIRRDNPIDALKNENL